MGMGHDRALTKLSLESVLIGATAYIYRGREGE